MGNLFSALGTAGESLKALETGLTARRTTSPTPTLPATPIRFRFSIH